MITDLKVYAEYKESGLPWLGQVPGHWEVETLRRCLRPSDGIKIGPFGSQLKLAHMTASGFKVYGQANVISGDIAQGSKYVDEAKFNALRECEVQPGDLLVTMMGTSGRCMVVPYGADAGLMDSHLLRLRLKPGGLDPVFAALTVDRASYVKEQVALAGKGSIMHGLNSGMVKNLVVTVPPLAEQAAIVRFLNWANGRIERAIRAKRKLIALLNEQKQAIIHRAVTRGLDATVLLKPSGIPWLGDIPEHWEVLQLRRLVSFVTSGSRGWANYYSDSGHIFLQSGNLGRSMSLNLSFIQYVKPPQGSEGERTRVRRDDLLVCITGALTGNVALVDGELHAPAFVNQHVALVRAKPSMVYPRFLAFVLYSEVGKTQFKTNEYGGTKQGLGLGDVKSVFVPLPSVQEQIAICIALDRQIAGFADASARTEREIGLLREYRTRLIADVVTGKLDVREAARQLPEAPAEPQITPDAEDLLESETVEAEA